MCSLGCFAQSGSPYSNNVFPAQSFTATAQTGAVIQLNGQQISYGAGTITVTGTALTTVTFAVQGSSDGGVTYYALPISAVASPGTTPTTTVTATASGLYQVSLVGITHVKFVTSGTFTATSVSLALTATPNFAISRNGGSSSGGTSAGVALLPGAPNVVYSFVATGDQAGSTLHDVSGNSTNATLTTSPAPVWTGTGLSFNNSSGTAAQLPASLNVDRTFCASVFAPFYTNSNGGTNASVILANSGINGSWSAVGHDFGSGYGVQLYQPYALINGGAGAFTGATPPVSGFHTFCWVQGLSGNSTVDRLFTDGQEMIYSFQNASGGTITAGNWTMGAFGGLNSFLTFYYFAGWTAQLTPAQIQQASLAMNAAVQARGVLIAPLTSPTNVPKLLAVGDSITCCGGSATTVWWPSNLSINSAYSAVTNEGISGFSAFAISGAASWRDTPQCYTGGQRTTVILFAGTNDLAIFGFTAAQTMNSIQSYVNYLRNAGCQVGVGTMLSRVGADASKDALNPIIRNGSVNGGYFVVDFASQPLVGADGAFAGADFNADQVHPNNAGQVLNGASASNAVNAYGIGAASAANPTPYVNTATMLSADRFVNAVPTAATTYTLPDCLGVTGAQYQIANNSLGANTITFAGKASEAITGSATLAQSTVARFQATLISQAAAGCGWLRVQ